MKLKTSNRKFKSLVNVILLMSPNITDHTSRWDAASFREICQQKSHFISLPFAFSTFFFAPQDFKFSYFEKNISFFCIFEKHVGPRGLAPLDPNLFYYFWLQGTKLWIIMEYLGGGSALDLMKAGKFEESHIQIILREVLKGLDYLHSEMKLHRDIKGIQTL